MIRRPSALQLAGECGMASVLAEQYPEGGEAAANGTMLHTQIAVALRGGPLPTEPAAKAAVSAVKDLLDDGWRILGIESTMRLEDPDTGVLVTEGTADLVLQYDSGFVRVVDWKSGRPENVTHPSANLQLAAYGLAAAMAHNSDGYEVQIGHIVDGRFWWGPQHLVEGPGMWAYLDQVKDAAGKPIQARTGPHCDGCWQKKHCPAFMLPAYQGETALAPFTQPNGLTHDNAAQALLVVQAMKEAIKVADERLKEFARRAGPIVSGKMEWGPNMVKGKRRGPTVKELEAAGMHDLIKEGEPSERFDWRKVRP